MKEIVMGLHWTPRGDQDPAPAADLDAVCVLLGADDRIIEVINPAHPRTAGDSVVHTGNSRDGANDWDDERIFVFLSALPAEVARVALCVVSVSGHALSRVPGVRCHLSDARREQALRRVELTYPHADGFVVVFDLRREADGWWLLDGAPTPSPVLAKDVRSWAPGLQSADEATTG